LLIYTPKQSKNFFLTRFAPLPRITLCPASNEQIASKTYSCRTRVRSRWWSPCPGCTK